MSQSVTVLLSKTQPHSIEVVNCAGHTKVKMKMNHSQMSHHQHAANPGIIQFAECTAKHYVGIRVEM